MEFKNLNNKNAPSLRMYQTVSEYPLPSLWTVIALWL